MILWFGKKKKKDKNSGETPIEPNAPQDAGIEPAEKTGSDLPNIETAEDVLNALAEDKAPEKKGLLGGLFGSKKKAAEEAAIDAEVKADVEDYFKDPYDDNVVVSDAPFRDDIVEEAAPSEIESTKEEAGESEAPVEEPEKPSVDVTTSQVETDTLDATEDATSIDESPIEAIVETVEEPAVSEDNAETEDKSSASAIPFKTLEEIANEKPAPEPELPVEETVDDTVEETQEDEDPIAETKKPGFFARMTKGLARSSSKLADGITSVFTKKKLDDETLEDLEDLLISSDLGANVAMRVCDNIRKDRFDKEVTDEEIKTALAEEITSVLKPREEILDLSEGPSPRVVLFVGVNGSGKTTTIGKIASKLSAQGADLLLAAGDTFRAAAVEQLKVWAERANAGFLSRPDGADSAGLAYDAITQAKKENRDLVLIDTAGRLQNRTELMDELAKVVRAIRKVEPTAPHDVILVLDATVGQNALSQVEAFKHTAGVTGLVMTKLDGTAKGGVLVAIADKHSLPIHFVGIGEKAEDLHPFSAEAFANALVGLSEDVTGNE